MHSTMRGLFFAACIYVSGCASAQPNVPTIENDQFSPQIIVRGIRGFENPFGGTSKIWFLRSFIDRKTRIASHQVYIDLGYLGSWRFYESAADQDTNPLAVSVIDREVNDCSGYGCSYNETLGIEIPDQYLRAHATSGFQFELSAHSGDKRVIEISAQMITQQLSAIQPYAEAVTPSASQAPALPQPKIPPLTPQTAAIPTPGQSVVLGISFYTLTPEAVGAMHLQAGHGLLVMSVTPNSPAAKADISRTDIILAIDGKPTASVPDIATILSGIQPGAKVRVHIWRGGFEMDKDVQF